MFEDPFGMVNVSVKFKMRSAAAGGKESGCREDLC